jgi:hypothetical protein
MVSAKLLIQRSQKKLDVQVGKEDCVLYVQKDGILTLKKSVLKLMIPVRLGMKQVELVNLATLVTSSQMEFVS